MGEFGERLRREREMRGVTLDEIAGTTKIGTRMLRALEQEEFERLPGGIFNKGFVRAYARYLGMNEEEAVTDYLRAAGDTTTDPRVIAEQNASRVDKARGGADQSRHVGFPVIPVLVLLVVIAAAAGGWQIYRERQRERAARESASTSAAAAIEPAKPAISLSSSQVPLPSSAGPSPSTQIANPQDATASNPAGAKVPSLDLNLPPTGRTTLSDKSVASDVSQAKTPIAVTNETAKENSAAGAFEVTVRPKERAWVSIKSDGNVVVRGIISPPEVKTIRASSEVVVWTGNASGVQVAFNGREVPLTGNANQVGVLVLNANGPLPPKPGAAAPAH